MNLAPEAHPLMATSYFLLGMIAGVAGEERRAAVPAAIPNDGRHSRRTRAVDMSINSAAADRFPVTSDADGARRIRLTGMLVAGNRDELKAQLVGELDRGATNLVLDLSQCGYIDSAGLGSIVLLSRRSKEKGAAFRVEGLNDDLQTLFELTKIDQVVSIVRGVSR